MMKQKLSDLRMATSKNRGIVGKRRLEYRRKGR